MHPIVKKAYPIYWTDDRHIRIGAQSNVTLELFDPNGELKVLIPLLNGMNTIDEIVQKVQSQIAYLSESDIREGIKRLCDANLLEDNDQYSNLTEREMVNGVFFSLVSKEMSSGVQQCLDKSHIVLLGLGGGGSACLPQLLSLGIKELTIVDYDVVTLENLNRQTLYHADDVGKKKVSVSERYCKGYAPECTVHAYDKYLNSVNDIENIVSGADGVICAIDEPRFIAQRRVNAAIVNMGVPCVFLLSQHTCGRFFSVLPNRSGCMDCLHIFDSREDEDFVKQFSALMHPYRQGSTAVISPHAQRLASFAVDELLRLVTHYYEPLALGKQMDVDYLTGSLTEVMSWEKERGCPTCGCSDPQYDYLFDIAPLGCEV